MASSSFIKIIKSSNLTRNRLSLIYNFSKRRRIINSLIHEQSLYLRQHAHQPVKWLPFKEDLFSLAQEEHKPLFISIGYSACHWCHVMARESFDDKEIARIINENFIPVKVDREEHPEIDAIYLLACEVVQGRAGWPLTIIALPDGRPFFAATYLPKSGNSFQPGLKEILLAISRYWQIEKKYLYQLAFKIAETLKKIEFIKPSHFDSTHVLTKAFSELEKLYDREHGGFGIAPKFPLPVKLLYLYRYAQKFENNKARELVVFTTLKMRYAAIFDQIGAGFHRYTIDRAWKVPHFEKMLYDQALLLYLYAEIAREDNRIARVPYEIFSYLEERLLGEEGFFYTAESAESEGEEGRFYTWSLSELRSLLTPEELNLLIDYFGLKEEGNYLEEATGRPNGRNVLHPCTFPWEYENDISFKLQSVLKKLKEHREKRLYPPRDEKIMVDWNSLVIAALAKAASNLDDSRFLSLAERTFKKLWERAFIKGRLNHLLNAEIKGFLDDYTFLAWAALELWEATQNELYLTKLYFLLDEIKRLFKSKEGLYQQVGADVSPLWLRFFSTHDGALPSANGILAYLFKKADQPEESETILRSIGGHLKERPSNFSAFLLALLA
ncbi:thioredoxin domain-containing protein [Thermodesulfatator autotrophicus]|uniref:Spermatogenesis-associated protein 20-like TRX domain-containing protein n=1 Tax=Thermodesulfatator autotrophicus TaxID=1795632 RepID=A0A177E5N7_9BACT|nr:thioredoxin domain-containing protein [Thermodesulfatator autotrophicus]OAG27277.1 hypothetical protein TH606_07665 [Thermodesulfatator autotrophicus]